MSVYSDYFMSFTFGSPDLAEQTRLMSSCHGGIILIKLSHKVMLFYDVVRFLKLRTLAFECHKSAVSRLLPGCCIPTAEMTCSQVDEVLLTSGNLSCYI